MLSISEALPIDLAGCNTQPPVKKVVSDRSEALLETISEYRIHSHEQLYTALISINQVGVSRFSSVYISSIKIEKENMQIVLTQKRHILEGSHINIDNKGIHSY